MRQWLFVIGMCLTFRLMAMCPVATAVKRRPSHAAFAEFCDAVWRHWYVKDDMSRQHGSTAGVPRKAAARCRFAGPRWMASSQRARSCNAVRSRQAGQRLSCGRVQALNGDAGDDEADDDEAGLHS